VRQWLTSRTRETYMFASRKCTPTLRETELKEEELKQYKEALRKGKEELRIRKEQLDKCKKNVLHHFITRNR
jgi:hypothetical protein